MWIIRLHKLQTKDYNFVARVLKKLWFIPRKVSPICFIKALFYHVLQKKSWRAIGNLLWTNHIVFYNFYEKYKKNPEIKIIFHYFLEARVIVFIGNKKSFSEIELDNSKEFYILTKREIENIVNK